MCTFGGCSQSYRTYSSCEDWQRHENAKHRLKQLWHCHDCDESWPSADGFRSHMMEKHGGTFMRSQLDNIIRLSKVVRLNERARRTCLLCRATLNSTLQAEYDHLAHHLLDVALFVLPAFGQRGRGTSPRAIRV